MADTVTHPSPSRSTILITGATGFIGEHICRTLLDAGYRVRAVHRKSTRILPYQHADLEWVAGDFSNLHAPEQWAPYLKDIAIVINSVGIISETRYQSFQDLHARAPMALFQAAENSKVKQMIQISALGADQKARSAYHLSKKQADDALRQSSVRHLILQPSIVYGPGDHSMPVFQALAAMPVIPVPGSGQQLVQPVHVYDLAAAVLQAVQKPPKNNLTLPVTGARPLTIDELLQTLSLWYGKRKARLLHIPNWFMALMAQIGSLIPGALFNRETWQMLQAGNAADARPLEQELGVAARDLRDHYAPYSASTWQKLNSGLFLWRHLLTLSLALVWIASGLVSLFWARAMGYHLLARVGLGGVFMDLAFYGASLLDISLGLLVLKRYRPYTLAWVQTLLVGLYTLVISMALPEYWGDPFGAVLKNVPLISAFLVWGALEHAWQKQQSQ
ncbi:MAG: NAD(P)H-binding protein [Leptospiraceae bacterium]|nr:NAD(P)H-binding protein [Leptospiraceae bacterium]